MSHGVLATCFWTVHISIASPLHLVKCRAQLRPHLPAAAVQGEVFVYYSYVPSEKFLGRWRHPSTPLPCVRYPSAVNPVFPRPFSTWLVRGVLGLRPVPSWSGWGPAIKSGLGCFPFQWLS